MQKTTQIQIPPLDIEAARAKGAELAALLGDVQPNMPTWQAAFRLVRTDMIRALGAIDPEDLPKTFPFPGAAQSNDQNTGGVNGESAAETNGKSGPHTPGASSTGGEAFQSAPGQAAQSAGRDPELFELIQAKGRQLSAALMDLEHLAGMTRGMLGQMDEDKLLETVKALSILGVGNHPRELEVMRDPAWRQMVIRLACVHALASYVERLQEWLANPVKPEKPKPNLVIAGTITPAPSTGGVHR